VNWTYRDQSRDTNCGCCGGGTTIDPTRTDV
jgi:hypothetical protein